MVIFGFKIYTPQRTELMNFHGIQMIPAHIVTYHIGNILSRTIRGVQQYQGQGVQTFPSRDKGQ